MYFRSKMLLAVCFASALVGTCAFAQEIRFPTFSSLAGLQLNGSGHQATWASQQVLRLTDGARTVNTPEATTTWFQIKQPLSTGFTTYFKFQIHGPSICCTPGDGLAFVVQNSSSTDSSYGATGAGVTALGVASGGMGYAGIPNSLAVEFDTTQDSWDPNANHVAVQSCGVQTNGPVHLPGQFTIGQNTHVTSCLLGQSQQAINTTIPRLGMLCGMSATCQNGPIHEVVIEYDPPQGNTAGSLRVWIDPQFINGTHTPVSTAIPQINVPYDMAGSGGLSLDNGKGWVGFTASQNAKGQAQDIMAWEFTPHTDTTVTQVIQNGGTQTTFTYGGYVYGVTYPVGFVNVDQIRMVVDAMPIDKATFYNTRLRGTAFANEQCVTYLETGGNCVVYRVSCIDQMGDAVACPSEETPTILIKSSYYTADNVSAANADFLKDPTQGQNQWEQLTDVQFQQNVFDPTTSGKGSSFSDFVATFITHAH